MRRQQDDLCRSFGVDPDYPDGGEKLGVAVATLDQVPLNGLRHPRQSGMCGWYIWGGGELSTEDDFFQPMHVVHLFKTCAAVLPYLALPPGWRFLIHDEYEDVWHDPKLLEV